MHGRRKVYSTTGIQQTGQLATRLKALREDRALSLQALAAKIGFSRSHVSNVERGVRAATLDFALACDRVLETGGELAALAQAPALPSRRTAKPAQLPPALGRFVGREDSLAQLDSVLERLSSDQPIPAVCVCGPPGGGKTTLAVWWAHRVRAHFPDGVLFADLHGFGAGPRGLDIREVMYGFLRALGVTDDPPEDMDEAAALFRTMLSDTRTLVVCDNAANAAQARKFLPGSPGCLLLVTSRDPMPSLVVRDGAVRVSAERFTADEALRLLSMVIGPKRLAAEPEAAAALVRSCDHLPLAVRIAAERIATHTHLTLSQLADDVARRDRVLDALSTSDETAAVRTVFSWSYDMLPNSAARLFRLLGLHPGGAFDTGMAVALAGAPRSQVIAMLSSLDAAYLVERGGPQSYRLHDLVHAYAAERALAEPEANRRDAVQRLLHWYLHSATTAVRTLTPTASHPVLHDPPPGCEPETFTSRSAAAAWCDRNLDNLVAAVSLAKVFDSYVAETLPGVLWDYYHRLKLPDNIGLTYGGRPPQRTGRQGQPAGFDPERREWSSSLGDGIVPVPPIEGELSLDRDDLARAGRDFGRRVRAYPLAVLKPRAAQDIAEIMAFARTCGITTVPRGQGYSTEGQSLAANGIVIDMAGFDRVHRVDTTEVEVDGGARWSDVLDATLPHGLMPPVLTNYVDVSVGGTLSAGGVSGASHHHGTQTDSVLALEVVTPDGRIVNCSETENRELFDAVRAGYGRHGVITRATLSLVPAPARVRRHFLGYRELDVFLGDQVRLAREGRFSYLEGQAQYDPARRCWNFLLEAAVYHSSQEEPEDAALLDDLHWAPGTEEHTSSTFVEFAHRLAPSEALLRSLGTWQHHAHPWINVMLPRERAAEVIAETLAGLSPADLGTGGVVSIYPLRTDRLRTPSFQVPCGEIAVLFGLLRTAPPDDPAALECMLESNAILRERACQAGGHSLLPPPAVTD